MKLFQSDFRYVADYLVQKRMTNDYKPRADLLQHVDETLKLMSVLTDDRRFEEVIEELPGKGGTSMCTVLDKVENKGREEGKLEGLAQGKLEGLAQGKLEGMIQVYYTKLHYSADQISRELDTPVDQIQEIIRKLTK